MVLYGSRNFVVILIIPPGSMGKPRVLFHHLIVVQELRVFKLDPDGLIRKLLCLDFSAEFETCILSAQLRDPREDGGGVVEDVLLL